MKTAGGWNVRWKYGVKGTNLAGTPEQKRTWYLWGYNPRGGQSILATVRKVGGAYDVRNSMRGGRLVDTIKGANALSRAKRKAERMVGIGGK